MTELEVRVDMATRDTIKPRCSPAISDAAVFTVSLAAGSCAASFEIRPRPERTLVPTLGAALGFGVATAVRRAHRDIKKVAVHMSRPIPVCFGDIGRLYEQLTGVSVTFGPLTSRSARPAQEGVVFLVSGGKDTLFALDQYARRAPTRGLPAVYLAGGAEMAWHSEIAQVVRVADYFGLDLHVFELHGTYSSSQALLRLANRASWRELVTITLARSFGNTIHTGINVDSVARLESPSPRLADHLSQLMPAINALEAMLDAIIRTVPGEFTVYGSIRSHPLFNRAGSCLTPACADALPEVANNMKST